MLSPSFNNNIASGVSPPSGCTTLAKITIAISVAALAIAITALVLICLRNSPTSQLTPTPIVPTPQPRPLVKYPDISYILYWT